MLELAPTNHYAHFVLGRCLEQRGEYLEARGHYNLAVSLRSSNADYTSRFGTVERLLACIEWCLDNEVTMYGGGQFELGVGRKQIQALASLFYAASTNDIAPAVYNTATDPRTDLPRTPLTVPYRLEGFAFHTA